MAVLSSTRPEIQHLKTKKEIRGKPETKNYDVCTQVHTTDIRHLAEKRQASAKLDRTTQEG